MAVAHKKEQEVYSEKTMVSLANPSVLIREYQSQSAKAICDAILGYAVEQDERLKQIGEADRLDDKTVSIMKRTD